MIIKNIVFDFGGVLIDWNPRYLYQNHFSDPKEMEWFLRHICTHEWNTQQDAGRTLKAGTELLVSAFPEQETMIRLFYSEWESMLNGPIHANVQCLKMLKNKYQLLGLTNWSSETFPIALEKYAFLEIFDGIVVSGEEKLIKPDPDIYTLMMERYSLKAPESLFVDDNKQNISTAKTLGFYTIHVTSKTDLKLELSKLGINMETH